MAACTSAPRDADGGPDAAVGADADASPLDAAEVEAPDVVTTETAPPCTAVRVPRVASASTGAPATSALAAPGIALETLRARVEASHDAQGALANSRAWIRDYPIVTLAPGDDTGLQRDATLALANAFVAFVDLDEAAANRAVDAMEASRIDADFIARAPEPGIRIGGALVALAGAVDVLASVPAFRAQYARARAALVVTSRAFDAWTSGPGALIVRGFASNNQGTRMGAGLLAAALVTAPDELPDEAAQNAVALLFSSVRAQGAEGAGWSEGPHYFAYALEAAAAPWAALDALAPPAAGSCARCPTRARALCVTPVTELTVAREVPALRGAFAWASQIETRGGGLFPYDDSRPVAVPGPLLDRLAGAHTFRRWRVDGPAGSLSSSTVLAGLVAFAVARDPLPDADESPGVLPTSGTAVLRDAHTELALVAEPMGAVMPSGHEHDDPLSVSIAHEGTLVLGTSGYPSYDMRGPYSVPAAHSLITVDGVFPMEGGAFTYASLRATPAGGATGEFSLGATRVARSITLAPTGEAMIEDTFTLDAPRTVTAHWHLRGALAADSDPPRWSVGSSRCTLTSRGISLTTARETAPHVDLYAMPGTHPVLRQRASLAAGVHTLTTTVRCEREPPGP